MHKITFWGLSILALLLQETVTSSTLLVILVNNQYSFILFSSLFLFITITEILVFHRFGKLIQSKSKNSSITHLVSTYISKVDHIIGKWGGSLFLIFLTASVFPPALSSFISTWLHLPFKTKFFSILIGDFIWYLIVWSIVIGTDLLTENPKEFVFKVVLISLLFVIFQRMITNRILIKKN
jgi:hypothetical protein